MKQIVFWLIIASLTNNVTAQTVQSSKQFEEIYLKEYVKALEDSTILYEYIKPAYRELQIVTTLQAERNSLLTKQISTTELQLRYMQIENDRLAKSTQKGSFLSWVKGFGWGCFAGALGVFILSN